MVKRLRLVIGAFSVSACATLMHGASQNIGISSSPTGAAVSVDHQAGAATPYVATLSRKDNHIVRLSMDGYAPAELTLTKSVSGWVWGNLVFGGLIGLGVDAISGGLYNLTPDQLQATLAKQGASIPPTKDGIYVVMVRRPPTEWVKVGQLQRLSALVGN
jgi:PEGA domain-containing protein